MTQPDLTVQQMDILTVLQNVDREVKHILGVKDPVADTLSRNLNFRRAQWNAIALEVTMAGEWIDHIKAGIIDDEWSGPIAYSLANLTPQPPAIRRIRKRM